MKLKLAFSPLFGKRAGLAQTDFIGQSQRPCCHATKQNSITLVNNIPNGQKSIESRQVMCDF